MRWVKLASVMNAPSRRLELSGNRKRWTTLVGCSLHLDFSFLLWVLLGALGIPLCEAAQLSPAHARGDAALALTGVAAPAGAGGEGARP